ncbi:hypothetical protein F4777DRAFT_552834 [Nemania sp. FL0916]|nr:hypothetical protein F4777DRAFT_552834 [Nemania sp. FL0916]
MRASSLFRITVQIQSDLNFAMAGNPALKNPENQTPQAIPADQQDVQAHNEDDHMSAKGDTNTPFKTKTPGSAEKPEQDSEREIVNTAEKSARDEANLPSPEAQNARLFKATKNGDGQEVQNALDQGADIHTLAGIFGETALHLACRKGYPEIVRILLNRGADVMRCDNDGWTPLIAACSQGSEEIVQLLIDNSADLETRNNIGFTALISACSNGFDKVVRLLINNGADVNPKSREGRAALNFACANGLHQVAVLLIDNGADINSQDNEKWSPLMSACSGGFDEIVQLLVDKGAELNTQDDQGCTALKRVCHRGFDKAARLLLRHGADINILDNKKRSPLMSACSEGLDTLAQMLIEKGADTNLQDNNGVTPLAVAARFSNSATLKMILDRQPDLTKNARMSRTAFHNILLGLDDEDRNEKVELLLSQSGFDLNARYDHDRTPLHLAIYQKRWGVVEKLLDKPEIQVDARDEYGLTVLHYACRVGRADIARKLLAKNAKGRSPGSRSTESALYFFAQYHFPSPNHKSYDNRNPYAARSEDAQAIWDEAGSEERAITILFIDNDKHRKAFADMMNITEQQFEYYKLIGLAMSPESSDRGKIVNILKNETDLEPPPSSPLQWAAFHGLHDVVWWLLKNSLTSKDAEADRVAARRIADTMGRRQEEAEQQTETQGEPTRTIRGNTKSIQNKNNLDRPSKSHKSGNDTVKPQFNFTIDMLVDPPPVEGASIDSYGELSDFSTLQKEELEQHQATIVDFYQRNGRVDLLRRSRSVYDVIYADTSTKEPAAGPEGIMKRARGVLNEISPEAAERKYRKKDLLLRWIHLPANNMEWMEDVTKRIYRDKKTNPAHWLSFNDLAQRSWREHPTATSLVKFMKPVCLKEFAPKGWPPDEQQDKDDDSYDMENWVHSSRKNHRRLALYMPYLTFGYCYRKDSKFKPYETYSKLMDAYKDKIIHGTRSLDQFFYNALPETDERDKNQVFTRSWFGVDNGQGVPDSAKRWPYLAVDQLWLWVIDDDTIVTSSTCRQDEFEDPVLELMFRQLREAKLKKHGQPPPSSVDEMSRFLVSFCADFINSLSWKDFSADEISEFDKEIASKSVQLIYADRINFVAAQEKALSHDFMVKMREKKEINEKTERIGSKSSKSTQPGSDKSLDDASKIKDLQAGPKIGSNNWTSISRAADLLDEVKDILDELTILKTLVSQQSDVWNDLVGSDFEYSGARDPIYTLRTIEEMIKMTEKIQDSVNEILGLEQNGINIDQANESARQGRILMFFTIPTVIFTPLSFLTSLFALNVTVFQHSKSGSIEYTPGWLFPILFGVTTGVIGLILIYVYGDQGHKFWRMPDQARLPKWRPWRSKSQKESHKEKTQGSSADLEKGH